ncbi:MAG: AMP-binding protein [Candidatus Melainabacteria bacterium]|nr:AMP-binding protein [Candidatus Melainabacteria bacterium]
MKTNYRLLTQSPELQLSRTSSATVSRPVEQGGDFVADRALERCSTEANIATKLDEIAASFPNFTALIQGSGLTSSSINFETLSRLVGNKAAILKSAGLRKGDLVLMLQPMSIDLYASILAVFRLGATVLIVDAAAGKDKVNHAIASTAPHAVIAAGKGIIASLALKSVRHIKLKFSDGLTLPGWTSLAPNNQIIAPVEPVSANHPALVTLTSGTSGEPKMIVRSHEFLQTQLQAVSSNCDVNEFSSELTSLPVFVLANLASCVKTVLPDANLADLKHMNVDRIINQLNRFQPERVLGSPAFIERIVSECAHQGITLPFVKKIITGGGPVFPQLLESAKAVFVNANLTTVYGSSEAEPVSKISFADLSHADLNAIANGAGLPVGSPVSQIRIRIEPLVAQQNQMNSAERLSALRHICELKNLHLDAVGEILVTGDHVVKGYDRGIGDEETKVRIDGEIWHRTGDVGYLDNSGKLWLTGRITNAALDTSFALSVEAAALFDIHVERAACLTLNNVTTLFIESTGAMHEIDRWTLKNRLNWSNLSAVKVVRKIPVDSRHSSKVLYHKLANSA